jgi:hypothetical protein
MSVVSRPRQAAHARLECSWPHRAAQSARRLAVNAGFSSRFSVLRRDVEKTP